MQFKDSNGEVLGWGDKVLVVDMSCDITRERIFIGITQGGDYITEEGTGSVVCWNYAVKVKAPDIAPWTFETCPLPPFTVQNKDTGVYCTITTIGCDGVLFSSTKEVSYAQLKDEYDYIANKEDRGNLLPCGAVKGDK